MKRPVSLTRVKRNEEEVVKIIFQTELVLMRAGFPRVNAVIKLVGPIPRESVRIFLRTSRSIAQPN